MDKGADKKNLISLIGSTTINRIRYLCDKCKTNYYPLDKELGISRSKVSKRLAKVCVQTTVFTPFEHARNLIKETTGISLSVTLLEQIIGRIGNKLHKEAEIKGRHPYAIKEKEKDVDTLYIEADGAMVPLVGENRREFKENKLGVVFNNKDIIEKITKKGEKYKVIKQKKFVSSIAEGVDPFKKMLYAAAIEKGLRKAKQVIFLCDGASWLAKCKDEYFPNSIQILDWYHAVENLWEAARAIFGENNVQECLEWVSPLEDDLWEGKVDNVIQFIEKSAMENKRKSTPLFKLRGYLISNRDHMKYDEYRRNGWYIGSGTIESANKYIITQRLKLSGMKWNKTVADAMIWARCKYFENDWDKFWDDMKLSVYLNHIPADLSKAA